MEKKSPWRPTVVDEKSVSLLLQAFWMSFSDEEACLFAWISKNSLYRYIERNPDFWNQKELLKLKPNIKAKINIIKSINNEDVDLSKWWLERKSKDEFSTKQKIEQQWETILNIINNDDKKLLDDVLNKNIWQEKIK